MSAAPEAPQSPVPPRNRIEDYALIGDCETAALVGRDGSVDWLCWPRFDSAACFAAMLGNAEHGRFRIAPCGAVQASSRAYRDGSMVLETVFETAEGRVAVVDCMPPRQDDSHLVRVVRGLTGRVRMRLELVLRFDYGASIPWVTRLREGHGICAVAGPDMVVLRSAVPVHGENMHTVGEFEVDEGEALGFVLSYGASHLPLPRPLDALAMLRQTEAEWRGWAHRCKPAGRWTEAVRRSVMTLKALTYQPTGGIVAAPTTSLPEQPGGVRNWDYRFCWLRDATLTLLALLRAGYGNDAARWRDWLLRAAMGSPAQIQIMYGIGGERRLPELELDWLPGHGGARPVRIGNAAASQLQLDVFGELLDALHQAQRHGLPASPAAWALQRTLIDHVEKIWQQPDAGMWEVRGPWRHFTFSKAMAWAAVDRAVRAVEAFGMEGPLERWRALRAAIHADVCAKAYRPQRGCFSAAYDGDDMDASLLLLPAIGFLPADDPRILATIAAVEAELVADGGLVRRYNTHPHKDGLPAGEGAFLACSFWLADAYALTGRLDKARALFEHLLALRNDVGLLAEEYDPVRGCMLGNFPQAFSHVALVNTAYTLAEAEDAAERAHPVRAGTPAGADAQAQRPAGADAGNG